MSDIHLYVYDLSKGMAKQFSAMFLGKHFDGVWHTGVVCYGQEWFFGNDGVDRCHPKGTILGEPNEIIKLGSTELSEDDFLEIIQQLADDTFKTGTYNLLEHNCNNFSHELATILVGKGIPQHILDLPKEVMNTPLGPMLRPMLEQAADPLHSMRTGQGAGLVKQFRKQANAASGTDFSSSSSVPAQSENELKEMPSTVTLFKPDIDEEFTSLLKHFEDKLKINDRNLLSEIKEYLQQIEVSWSISSNHIKCLFEIYSNSLESAHMVTIIRVLQRASLDRSIAKLIVEHKNFIDSFVPSIKPAKDVDIKYNSVQLLSNVCAHNLVSRSLLKEHQDILFSELSELVLIEPQSDADTLVHQSSISFFYNLVSAYHLEDQLKDSNALSLGCALMERLPKLKLEPKSIYHMLSLVRSCLTTSEDMRSLALSMEFDMSKFQGEMKEKDSDELTTSINKIIKS